MSKYNLYDRRWRAARIEFLAANPLCLYCQQAGKATPAAVVDHVVPHRGDPVLFWDVSNWAPLCLTHHNGAKQSEEKRGHVIGCDTSGAPLDPQNPWNQGQGAGRTP